jgi:RNA polymerase sigma factor (sigma-70 family)
MMSKPSTRDQDQVLNELLALRCKRGDFTAFEELSRAWQPRLFYYLRRLVDEEQDAWDLLQEVWLKVIRGIPGLRNPSRLPVWLYRIAHHTAMSYRRACQAESCVTQDPSQTDLPDEASDWRVSSEQAELVHFALDKIALPYREVLTLHFLDDLAINEISEILEVPPGTVKSRLFHAKHALRAALKREETT